MQHLPMLISDLALILGSAAVISVLFKLLKQPIVLGYLLAGLLVGPNFKLFPTVVESQSITVWAEIGVIFLLFGLGLEFSFKKLIRIAGVAGIMAIIGVSLTLLTGFFLGRLLGWAEMDCLFFGGILAIASTTIIIRSFDELGVKSQNFANLVTGILVIEDLVAVILMVILSTVSVSRSFEGTEMLISILKLIFFLIVWVVSGIYFLPTLLHASKKFLSDETLLMVSVALCLLMVILANEAGFSPALGAFIMGSILAETNKAEKIEKLIKPLKNVFGAVFFVSVGMLINIDMVVEHYIPVIAGSFILLFAKPFFVATGALVSGQSLKTSVQTGMSLSQIGEFSFIIASLGLSLHVISDHLYPIAVAISVITTFTTPLMIRLSEPTYRFINSVLPEKFKLSLDKYSFNTLKATEIKAWKLYLRNSLVNIIIYVVIILSIIILGTRYLSAAMPEGEWNKLFTVVFCLLLLSPFLWALMFRREKIQGYELQTLKLPVKSPLFVLRIFRIFLALFLIGFLFDAIYSPVIATLGILISSALLMTFRRKLKNYYNRIESQFISNWNAREAEQIDNRVLAPWDSHIATFEIHPTLPLIGKTLKEIKLREQFGINIASIQRGEIFINVPERDEKLYPYDLVSIIGTDNQLSEFKKQMENDIKDAEANTSHHEVSLHHFTINEKSFLIGKSIRQTNIRVLAKGLVVGVERNNYRVLNPESDFIFEVNDTVWMVADDKRMKIFIEKMMG